MKNFDLNLLNILVALDQTRHAGRAAELLEMSQSGFSTALARLRNSVGDEVFVRSGAGMLPTTRGLALAATARAVLKQVETEMLNAPSFDPTSALSVFKLTMSDVAEALFIPPLMERFSSLAPSITIQIVTPGTGPLTDRLSRGEIDIAIGYFPDLEKDWFYRQALFQHTYACIVREGHPVAKTGMSKKGYESLGHAVVATPTRSNALLESALERQHLRRKIILSTPHHMSLPAIIARSDLVATVPLGAAMDFSQSGKIKVLPLPFIPPVFTIHQYWHARTKEDSACQWLRAQIKQLISSSQDPYAEDWKRLYGDAASKNKFEES